MEIEKQENKTLYELYADTVIIYQNVIKEANQIEIKYNIEFGSLEIKKFKASIEVIRLKKSLSYIILKKNKGEPVTEKELEEYIEKEMEEYKYELEDLMFKVKLSRTGVSISTADERKCKQLFYKIAKLIHPDLHPEYELDDEIMDLWNLAKTYYENCSLDELQKTYDAVLVRVNDKTTSYDIPNLEEKIQEYKDRIEFVRTTLPYTLEIYLKDAPTKYQHKEEMNAEIESLKDYARELEAEIQLYLNGESIYVQ